MDKKTDIKKILLDKINSCLFIDISNKNIDEILDKIGNQLSKGIRLICIKNNTNDRFFIETAKKIRQLCSIYDSFFLIKGRCDIINLVKADGIYLDLNDIDIISAHKLLDKESIFAIDNEMLLNEQIIDENLFDIVFITNNNKPLLNQKISSLNKKILHINQE